MNFEKYIEEVVNKKEFAQTVENCKEELLNCMLDYGGEIPVVDLATGNANVSCEKEFLKLLRINEAEIEELKDVGDMYTHNVVTNYCDKLQDDLVEICEQENVSLDCFILGVGYNREGNIGVTLYYEDYESIECLDEDEYFLHKTLSDEFNCSLSEVINISEGVFQIEGTEYLVLLEDEADEKAGERIKDALWTFKPIILEQTTKIPRELFEALQDSGRCETHNHALYLTIDNSCGIDTFVETILSIDGRGQYLNRHNGEEIEIDVDGETYYIYKQ